MKQAVAKRRRYHRSGDGDTGSAPFEHRLSDLLLVEYEAARADNQARITAQVTLVGFMLTIATALSAVALSSGTSGTDTKASGPDRLLLFLLVPLVVNGLGFFYILHNTARGRIAAYTMDVVYPAFTSAQDLSWSAYQFDAHRTRQWFRALVIVIANLAIFTTFDTVALALVFHKAMTNSAGTAAIWTIDAIFSLGLIAAAVTSAHEFARPIDTPLFGSPTSGIPDYKPSSDAANG